ncbi:TPA: hypothetical protein QDB51_002640 [Burkholderia vietnamiensis]|nr:hypothetical protein [Burkholderia vietnamiensis]
MGMFDFWKKKKENPGEEPTFSAEEIAAIKKEVDKEFWSGLFRREPDKIAKQKEYDRFLGLEQNTKETVADTPAVNIDPYREEAIKAINKDNVVKFEEALKHTPYDNEYFTETYFNRSPNCMKFILENDYTSLTEDSRIPAFALELGDLELLKLSKEKGADIEGIKDDLLQGAIRHENIPIADYLLQQGADINYVTSDVFETEHGVELIPNGKTNIELAALNESSKMLDWVARHGGDMDKLRGVELQGECKDYVDTFFVKKDFAENLDNTLARKEVVKRAEAFMEKIHSDPTKATTAQVGHYIEHSKIISHDQKLLMAESLKDDLDFKLPEKAQTKPSFSDMVQSAVQQPQTRSGKRKM